jgi:hypothetical protein
MGFHITKKEPSVTAMSVHLQADGTYQRYQTNSVSGSRSTLQHYFARPPGAFSLFGVPRLFSDLTYTEYFTLFRLAKFDVTKTAHAGYYIEQDVGDCYAPMHVILRSTRNRHFARLRELPTARGEVFYLRALLQKRPASSFLHLRTVDGIEHATFQEAATALGVFANQTEDEYALWESTRLLKTPAQLRYLFVHLLITDCVRTPIHSWNTFKDHLTLDFTIRFPDAGSYATDQALIDISHMLEACGKQPSDYQLPEVSTPVREVQHELDKWAPHVGEIAARAQAARHGFNPEQHAIFEEVMSAVHAERPLLLFVDGKAGVGKSFLVNALCDEVRSQNLIVLPTATSAFAAQLYQGGRTLHSTFKVRKLLVLSLHKT